MVEMQSVCEDVLRFTEGALGCAAINLATGRTLAAVYRSETALDANGMDLVAVAASEMFQGRLIREFYRAWSGGQAESGRFVREIQLATTMSYHFMSVIPGWESCLLVLITDKTVSLGVGWMNVHHGLARMADVPRTQTDSPTEQSSAAQPVPAPEHDPTAHGVPDAVDAIRAEPRWKGRVDGQEAVSATTRDMGLPEEALASAGDPGGETEPVPPGTGARRSMFAPKPRR